MLDPEEHAGELAELYALGELNDLDRARVERHAAACDACARRIGEAEATVLRLIESDAMPPIPERLDRRPRFTARSARPPRAWIAAVAAAFVIGLLPWGIETTQQRSANDAARGQQAALQAMLAGHFIHAPFAPLAPNAPAAKVIYAREGGWLYVIVAPGSDSLDVATIIAGKRAVVATIAAGKATRFAFILQPVRVDSMQLLDRGVPVAQARVIYATSKEP